eukprot:506507-Hanusia_phi.AAC.4
MSERGSGEERMRRCKRCGRPGEAEQGPGPQALQVLRGREVEDVAPDHLPLPSAPGAAGPPLQVAVHRHRPGRLPRLRRRPLLRGGGLPGVRGGGQPEAVHAGRVHGERRPQRRPPGPPGRRPRVPGVQGGARPGAVGHGLRDGARELPAGEVEDGTEAPQPHVEVPARVQAPRRGAQPLPRGQPDPARDQQDPRLLQLLPARPARGHRPALHPQHQPLPQHDEPEVPPDPGRHEALHPRHRVPLPHAHGHLRPQHRPAAQGHPAAAPPPHRDPPLRLLPRQVQEHHRGGERHQDVPAGPVHPRPRADGVHHRGAHGVPHRGAGMRGGMGCNGSLFSGNSTTPRT